VEDWVGVHEALVACWVKQGTPTGVAEEMFRRTTDVILHDGAASHWIYISDYQIIAHRIGDEYFFRRDEFTRLLELMTPNKTLIDIFASSADFVWED
jgi:hypothetical protein